MCAADAGFRRGRGRASRDMPWGQFQSFCSQHKALGTQMRAADTGFRRGRGRASRAGRSLKHPLIALVGLALLVACPWNRFQSRLKLYSTFCNWRQPRTRQKPSTVIPLRSSLKSHNFFSKAPFQISHSLGHALEQVSRPFAALL